MSGQKSSQAQTQINKQKLILDQKSSNTVNYRALSTL